MGIKVIGYLECITFIIEKTPPLLRLEKTEIQESMKP